MATKRSSTKSAPGLDLENVRRAVIRALAADDRLGDLLVLKGGNALRLVHQLGIRTSQDLDYSIEGDLDPSDVTDRIERALKAEFQREGYVPFDVHIEKKPVIPPEVDQRPEWGGWRVHFKLISRQRLSEYGQNIAKLRDHAITLYEGKKSFRIDISRYEYVEPADDVEFEGFPLRVYSRAMIVYEKLRAVCQQMAGYEYVAHPTPRPRDFVDICSVLDSSKDEVLAQRELLEKVFEAKRVPVGFLLGLPDVYEFHNSAWQKVADELGDGSHFRPYFDRVLSFVDELQPLGVVQPPV